MLFGASGSGRRFSWLGGRRYMVGDSYILPRDLTEANRIDFQHYLLRTAMRGNYASPLNQPGSILDVGCGNGRWAMEMAQIFPAARVIGMDLVVPPTETNPEQQSYPRPANYSFVQGNVLEDLPFPDATFDFVHQRLLYGSIPAAQWPVVVDRLVRVTRPGGWVELVESELMQGSGHAVSTFNGWLIEATMRRGNDIQLGRQVDRFLREAGLTSVVMHQVDIPIGQYGGHIGKMMETNTYAFISGFRGLVVGQKIATDQEYTAILEALRDEIQRSRYTIPYFVAYGQRP
jgi:ubiquinone/menaquinone biosynthesis C-methylase UbiE